MYVPEAAVGAILAAVISSMIALLGLIISKENKTSEFRQQWIDDLREDVAALIAYLDAVRTTLRLSGGGGAAWAQERESVVAANRHLHKIRLRMNPQEKDAAAVLELLNELERLYKPHDNFDWGRMEAIEVELLSASKAILKAEWNRVRDGEKVFRWAKGGFFILLIVAVVALAAAVWELVGG